MSQANRDIFAPFLIDELRLDASMNADEIAKTLNRVENEWTKIAQTGRAEEQEHADEVLSWIDQARDMVGTKAALDRYTADVHDYVDRLLDHATERLLQENVMKTEGATGRDVAKACADATSPTNGIPPLPRQRTYAAELRILNSAMCSKPFNERDYVQALEPFAKACDPYLDSDTPNTPTAGLKKLKLLNALCSCYLFPKVSTLPSPSKDVCETVLSHYRASANALATSSESSYSSLGHFRIGMLAYHWEDNRKKALRQFKFCIVRDPNSKHAKTARSNIDAINRELAEEEAKRKAEEEAAEARRKAEEEAKRKAEEEAKRKAEQDSDSSGCVSAIILLVIIAFVLYALFQFVIPNLPAFILLGIIFAVIYFKTSKGN